MQLRDSPIIYVCSPYSGDKKKNVKKAKQYCRYVMRHGGIPLAPHLYFPRFISEEIEREIALCMDMRLLQLCQELWVFGIKISSGMRREICCAEELGIPVKYIREELYVRD